MTPLEIANLVLDARPDLLEKWADPKLRMPDSGVTPWLRM